METFERKETKYLLTPAQYMQFRAIAEQHMVPAEYPEGYVSSVYYDTPDDALINRSLQGGKYKEKLRVRTYGQSGPDAPAFVEIKKKFKGITYKRRVTCTAKAAEAFLSGMDYEEAISRWPLASAAKQEACLSRTSLQIAGEIAWMRDSHPGLAPKMRVSTHRLSFVDADDPELRITFDADVRWESLQEGMDRNLFAAGERILEVKCSQGYPLWLVRVLGACDVRPQSVSKYGLAYQAYEKSAREEALVALGKRLADERAQVAAFAPAAEGVYRPAPASRRASASTRIRVAQPRRVRSLLASVKAAFAAGNGLTVDATGGFASRRNRKPAHAHR